MVKPIASGSATSPTARASGRVMIAVSRSAQQVVATEVAISSTRNQGWRRRSGTVPLTLGRPGRAGQRQWSAGDPAARDAVGDPRADGFAEVRTGPEILDPVGRLLGEDAVLDQREGDPAEVLAAAHAPGAQHQVGEQAVALDREVEGALDQLVRGEVPLRAA